LAICHDVVATIGLQTWREDIELPDGSRSNAVKFGCLGRRGVVWLVRGGGLGGRWGV
jgi:hypothetical protein